jgi:Na+-translocating ferredoxin:NAD+ oxidoreductase RnfG subunit
MSNFFETRLLIGIIGTLIMLVVLFGIKNFIIKFFLLFVVFTVVISALVFPQKTEKIYEKQSKKIKIYLKNHIPKDIYANTNYYIKDSNKKNDIPEKETLKLSLENFEDIFI